MNGLDRIAGAEQLVAIFGRWPSFHDAEVLWIRLDRGPIGNGQPTLEAAIHAFEMTSDIDANGYYVLQNHVLVHLRFQDVAELRLDGFNHQNALQGLTLTDLLDHQMEQVLWDVEFDPAFGVAARFQCRRIEVVSVQSCDKNGEPTSA